MFPIQSSFCTYWSPRHWTAYDLDLYWELRDFLLSFHMKSRWISKWTITSLLRRKIVFVHHFLLLFRVSTCTLLLLLFQIHAIQPPPCVSPFKKFICCSLNALSILHGRCDVRWICVGQRWHMINLLLLYLIAGRATRYLLSKYAN